VVALAREESIMKANFIVAGISAALLLGYAAAFGQGAQRAQQAPMSPGVTSHVEDPTETDSTQPVTEQPTAGHDEVSGNDEVSTDGGQASKTTDKHPNFASLDQNSHGYLTADDVKYNKWLRANFSRCDTNHDGHLSQQEYANCK
jgi:hypothetical protein